MSKRTLHQIVAADLRADGIRAMTARRFSFCPCCQRPIEEGQCIVQDEGRWIRSDCYSARYHEDKAKLPRVVADPYLRSVWAGVRATARSR